MGKIGWGVVALLWIAVACGHSQKHPGKGGTAIGSAGAGGDPARTPGEQLGGAGGDTSATDAGARTGGAASDGDQAAAGAKNDALGGAGGASGTGAAAGIDSSAGAGGADECADTVDVELEAPLATTSLTIIAPYEVSLGQGFQGDLL